MSKRFIALLCVFFISICCFGQEDVNDWTVDWSKEAFIQQITQQYLEPLELQLTQETHCRNYFYSLQHGNSNKMLVRQNNSGNRMIAIQEGDENEILTNMNGHRIENYVVQEGYQNRVEQELSGTLQHAIFQQGSHHEVTVNENGNHYPKLLITQKGVGMKLIINNGSIGYP